MSDKQNDGRPAFPGQWYDFQPTTGEQVVREQWSGLSLRDWFAGQALTKASQGSNGTADDTAKRAYYIADAMLAARERGAK